MNRGKLGLFIKLCPKISKSFVSGPEQAQRLNEKFVFRFAETKISIAHCRNVRELGKSMVVFCLFEKLRYSNERSTKFQSFKNRNIIEEENGKMAALQISPKIESFMNCVDMPQNFKGLYGILQLLHPIWTIFC